MTAQRLEILELLPEGERVSPTALYLPDSARGDSEALVQGLTDWVNFLREEARFETESLSPEVRALYQAAGYHTGVYNDWHALFIQNLRRAGTCDATLDLIAAGLARLDTQDYAENFAEAVRLYRANAAIWDAEDFGPYSDAYAEAKAVMAPVDQRYCGLLDQQDLEALIARAIPGLPDVRFVANIDAVRADALRSTPLRNDRVRELLAEKDDAVAEDAEAEKARIRHSLSDPVDFAGEVLAEIAGFAGVVSKAACISGKTEEGQDIEIWPIALRNADDAQHYNKLVRGGGNFALLDFQMDEVLAAATEIDLERSRLKLLAAHGGEEKPKRGGLFGLFGRRR